MLLTLGWLPFVMAAGVFAATLWIDREWLAALHSGEYAENPMKFDGVYKTGRRTSRVRTVSLICIVPGALLGIATTTWALTV